MKINKEKVKRILVITLSNVGDAILTSPVVEALAREFPASRVDIMAGPHGREVFAKHPRITKLMVYDKHMPLSRKIMLLLKLKNLGYDFIVDLRNTAIPYLLLPRYRTKTLGRNKGAGAHKKDTHLFQLENFGIDTSGAQLYIATDKLDEDYADRLLGGIDRRKLVLVSPGAKSHAKRWPPEYFIKLCDRMHAEIGASCALIGDENDRSIADEIISGSKVKPADFVEKTSLTQLASLMKKARLLVTNDSAPLHLASAVNTPSVAIFGPTDEAKYGPCSDGSVVMRNGNVNCAPCEKARCEYNYECMRGISAERVFEAAKKILN